MALYIKSGLAIFGSFLGALFVALDGDSAITVYDWTIVGGTVLASGGVTWWLTRSTYAKAIGAALTASLGSLSVAVVDGSGVTQQEWLTVGIAGIGILTAVYQIPNSEEAPAPAGVPGP
jgi:hypothetical protein